MEIRTDLPQDPTKPMRKRAIQNSVSRASAILKSVGKSDLSPSEVADEARLRMERAKTKLAVESLPQRIKKCESE